jgi:hypothetical protein
MNLKICIDKDREIVALLSAELLSATALAALLRQYARNYMC